MLNFLRSLLGPRYREREKIRDTPCDDCEQREARQRLHEVADRLNVLRSEVELFERKRGRDDPARHDH